MNDCIWFWLLPLEIAERITLRKESTATMLGDAAQLCLDHWGGDLRRLNAEADGDPSRLRDLLIGFPGIGPIGADIVLREVQGVWPEIAPYTDRKVLDGADRLHLPTTPDDLVALAPAKRLPVFLSALVRVARDRKAADAVLRARTRRARDSRDTPHSRAGRHDRAAA